MTDAVRRVILVALIFGLATAGLFAVRGKSEKYGLFNLLRGKPLPEQPATNPEKATLPTGTGLTKNDVPGLARLSSEVADVTDVVMPSVVSIAANAVESVDAPEEPLRLGAGVIVSSEGHVMTAYHVVHRVRSVLVRLADDRVMQAQIVGANPRADIAVLKIISPTEESFSALPFVEDSNTVRTGEIVLSFGNPFGLRRSMDMTNISAKERSFGDGSADLFQTAKPLLPGHSGGPLVNVLGEIVGINTARYGSANDAPDWAAVGIAVVANDARDNLLAILRRGKPVYGHLGVRVKMPGVYNHLRAFDSDLSYPIVVDSLERGSAAEAAGLKRGDIIKEFAGEVVKNFDQLKRLIRTQQVGGKVTIVISRDGKEQDLSAVMAELDLQALVARAAGVTSEEATDFVRRSIGADVRNLNIQEKTALGLKPGEGGIIVTEIHPGHVAQGRLAPGDFVQICNGLEFENAAQFASLIKERPAPTILLMVTRKGPHDSRPLNQLVALRPRLTGDE